MEVEKASRIYPMIHPTEFDLMEHIQSLCVQACSIDSLLSPRPCFHSTSSVCSARSPAVTVTQGAFFDLTTYTCPLVLCIGGDILTEVNVALLVLVVSLQERACYRSLSALRNRFGQH
jgi:hypothetical protein